MAHYALALDVGGTFTDVILMHRASGQLWTVKMPSTPADPAQGFFQMASNGGVFGPQTAARRAVYMALSGPAAGAMGASYVRRLSSSMCVQRGPHYDLAGMEAVYRPLHAEAVAYLTAEGLPPERQSFQRLADLRYARQGFEVTVELPSQKFSATAIEQLLQAFHRRHEQLYTYAAPDTPVEIVNLRLRAVGQMEKLTLPRIATAVVPGTTPDPIQTRPVYFSGQHFVDTPVYARHALQATQSVRGSAIVEQSDTTTVIFAGQEAVVDIYGNLLIHLPRS